MSDIRKYIDLVEQQLKEWPFSKPVDIDKRINGRKGPSTIPPPTGLAKPADWFHGNNRPHDYDNPEVETARRFKSAEAYAYDPGVNQYMPINTWDHPNVKQRAKSEADRLIRKWNLWKQQGYI